MNGKYLLDTNIIIALFAGDDAVRKHIEKAKQVYIPSIAIGELFYGAYKSSQRDRNIARVLEFAYSSTILYPDVSSARKYGEFKYFLKEKGRPVPENDLWVAAIASRYELTLISRDEHFRELEGIPIDNWM